MDMSEEEVLAIIAKVKKEQEDEKRELPSLEKRTRGRSESHKPK